MTIEKFRWLDGRHRLAILASIVCWVVSLFFSKEGFALDANKAAWLGWVLACVVTVMELIFNSKTHKLSLTLIVVGILCYAYGVWTNITGFWSYQHPNVVFDFWSQKSWMSDFVGAILEILPEPMFMWGIGSEIEGDLLGNLIGLWSGNLDYAQPNQTANVRPPEHSPIEKKAVYVPPQPKTKHEFPKDSLMTKQSGHPKLASPIFNNKYTDRYKSK